MYRITVENDFSSAHQLREYEGKCSSLHGHNWRVQLTVRSRQVDSRGISIDFGQLKRILAELVEQFDHVNLNATPPFDKINPTAENIAHHIRVGQQGIAKGCGSRQGGDLGEPQQPGGVPGGLKSYEINKDKRFF